ncbi:MAG: haloacid dehalogenase-like hydrolase [Thermoanaerobaculia bacterium]
MALERLAIFDLDGTLTRTMGVDGRCYVRACREVLELSEVSDDWALYRHTTDEGIARELAERHLGRETSADEMEALRRRFVELLRVELDADAQVFAPVPGAREVLAVLPHRGWAVVIATGAWEASARLKLEAAGLPEDLPLATSDGRPERYTIARHAIRLARERHQVGGFSEMVVLGDAVWDIRAADELGVPFVGVDAEGGGEALRKAGAVRILHDYLDVDRVLTSLARPYG